MSKPRVSKPRVKGALSTYTITMAESGENHAGMQIIGTKAKDGFTAAELGQLGHYALSKEFKVEFHRLDALLSEEHRKMLSAEALDSACILIIRNGVELFHPGERAAAFKAETRAIEDQVDKKAFMKGKVVNKLARWNLCYGDCKQAPDYEAKKGTIVPFSEVPYLNHIRTCLPLLLGPKAKDLIGELNYYYDNSKCGINYHGDAERTRVVGIRVGASLPLVFYWHLGKPTARVSAPARFDIHDGDIYVMGAKAVGTDWRKQLIPTLRHAAGCDKYIE